MGEFLNHFLGPVLARANARADPMASHGCAVRSSGYVVIL
ncbi:hypothetical protein BTZ20_4038 [Rhodococcus sp. MTM3W5.2]|nr:hypothetical protein BTZ20_4038 [Rhodococcus sp. MTM3W5.2]